MLAITARPTVETLVMVAAGLAALASIFHYVRKACRWGRRVVQAVVDFAHRMEKVVENVETQLYPNGGASLRDAVNRIQKHLGIDDVDVDAHKDAA